MKNNVLLVVVKTPTTLQQLLPLLQTRATEICVAQDLEETKYYARRKPKLVLLSDDFQNDSTFLAEQILETLPQARLVFVKTTPLDLKNPIICRLGQTVHISEFANNFRKFCTE